MSTQFLESHALGKPLVPLKTKLFFHKDIPRGIVSILLSKSLCTSRRFRHTSNPVCIVSVMDTVDLGALFPLGTAVGQEQN